MPLQAGAAITPNVQLLRMLGEGGMGSVWLAEHRGLGKRVAVKVIAARHHDDTSARARFQREARAAAGIDSPHVVRIFDSGLTADGEPYIVMEWLQGETLRERLRRGPLSLLQTSTIVQQLGLALDAAHEAGVVHRDLKPSNVFLVAAGQRNHTSEDKSATHVKLLDFGVAKEMRDDDQVMTRTGALIGSPKYTSPEQLLYAKGADWRSDLWSLGVVCYELLAGEAPFAGETVTALSMAICNGAYEPLSRATSLPAELDGFFKQALAGSPEDRFQSAGELAQALRELANQLGDVVHAPRKSHAGAESDPGSAPSPRSVEAADNTASAGDTTNTNANTTDTNGDTTDTAGNTIDTNGDMTTTNANTANASGGPVLLSPNVLTPEHATFDGATRETEALAPETNTPRTAVPGARTRRQTIAVASLLALMAGGWFLWSAMRLPGNAHRTAAATSPPTASTPDATRTTPNAPTSASGYPMVHKETPNSPQQPGPTTSAQPLPIGMVPIPAGRYRVGCDQSAERCFGDEPSHEVTITAFAISMREVTVAEYAQCIATQKCSEPAGGASCRWRDKPDTVPLRCVSWNEARHFCHAQARRLPTELEWEVAARGVSPQRYPWGDAAPHCSLTIMAGCGGRKDISTAADRSPFGVLDMGGSVREWTDSDYAPYPGAPAVTDSGKVNRGGSYLMPASRFVAAHTRQVDAPTQRRPDLGFRCALTL